MIEMWQNRTDNAISDPVTIEMQKAKEEQTNGGAADATETKALGKKKALKRVINNKASHKRERAMRRMYGDLTPEEMEQMNNSNRVDSKKKKKAKKKMEEEVWAKK